MKDALLKSFLGITGESTGATEQYSQSKASKYVDAAISSRLGRANNAKIVIILDVPNGSLVHSVRSVMLNDRRLPQDTCCRFRAPQTTHAQYLLSFPTTLCPRF